MSDREEYGLRGSIKTCVEESAHAGAIAADGTQIPEWTSRYTTEYSAQGRLMATRSRNSDGSEWLARNTYDPSGHLLKSAWGSHGDQTTETVYFYDDHGKLLKFADSRRPDNPVTFRYDERGRKTKLQVSRSEDYQPNLAAVGSPFQVADSAPNLPSGGSATTFYDEQDRPTEVQVRDAQGELLKRAVRTYDPQGRVSEEQQILENPESILPAQIRAEILKESRASMEELREHLTKLMGGQAGPFSIVYSYDAQGRVKQTRRRIFNKEDVTETIYNEHSDKAVEITRSTQIGSEKEHSAAGLGLPQYSEVRYSYQYDNHGNWTEEIVSSRSDRDGTFESSTGRRRHLTYY